MDDDRQKERDQICKEGVRRKEKNGGPRALFDPIGLGE